MEIIKKELFEFGILCVYYKLNVIFVNVKAMFFWLDFIFPPKCLGCQKEGGFVCEKCLQKIQLKQMQNCPICKLKINQGEVCLKCKKKSALSGVFVASSYEQNLLLRKMVNRFKYKYNRDLGESLAEVLFGLDQKLMEGRVLSARTTLCPPASAGQALQRGLKESLSQEGKDSFFLQTGNYSLQTVLVPVPLHFLRRFKRGFNQAEVLVDAILKPTGLQKINLLKRIRNTPQQAKLSRKERRLNLKGAFVVDQKKLRTISFELRGCKILLVDDVASTLSTLEECAKALRKVGFKEIWGVVLARG